VVVLRALLILAAVSALATLPCLVALMMSVGPPRRCYRVFSWISRRLRRSHRIHDPSLSRRERRGLARLDRCFGPELAPAASPDRLPIEKVAADLRRLRRQRTGIAQRSPVWRSAIEDAYDDRLRLACERLGIAEHLSELTGFDREIERVRLEGELEAAGIALHGYEAAAQ
jgi:hypothetical protein